MEKTAGLLLGQMVVIFFPSKFLFLSSAVKWKKFFLHKGKYCTYFDGV